MMRLRYPLTVSEERYRRAPVWAAVSPSAAAARISVSRVGERLPLQHLGEQARHAARLLTRVDPLCTSVYTRSALTPRSFATSAAVSPSTIVRMSAMRSRSGIVPSTRSRSRFSTVSCGVGPGSGGLVRLVAPAWLRRDPRTRRRRHNVPSPRVLRRARVRTVSAIGAADVAASRRRGTGRRTTGRTACAAFASAEVAVGDEVFLLERGVAPAPGLAPRQVECLLDERLVRSCAESRLLSGGQGRPQRRHHARLDASVGGFGRFAWGGMLGVGPEAG